MKIRKIPSDGTLFTLRLMVEADRPVNGMPSVNEDFYDVVATSPQEAKDYFLRDYSGPIDRLDIVGIEDEKLDTPIVLI